VNHPDELKNPLVSPLFAELHGLPPMLIQIGEAEIFHDQDVAFGEKAKMAGVDVRVTIWKDMVHVFQAFWSVIGPIAMEAIREISDFVNQGPRLDVVIMETL